MSYSRWGSSHWYSFWSTASGPTKDEQILSLWYNIDMTHDWTYADLKNITIDDLTIEYAGVPHNELLEAQELISAFMADVDGASDAELVDSYIDFLEVECGIDPVDLNVIRGYN